MGPNRKEHAHAARAWLGNLLAAWAFVTSLAIAFAAAWYHRTGDLKVLLAYLGAPFLIGVALFAAVGVLSLLSRTKPRVPVEADGVRARKQREGWFGRW